MAKTIDNMIHAIRLFPKEGLDNHETALNIEAILHNAIEEAKKRNVGLSWTFVQKDDDSEPVKIEKPVEFSSYAEFDKEWAKRQKELDNLQENVDEKRRVLTRWVADQVIALSHKGIYRQ